MMSGLGGMIGNIVKCVKCGASMGQCDCWTKCVCGWSFEKGGKCNNPKCGGDLDKPMGIIATGIGILK